MIAIDLSIVKKTIKKHNSSIKICQENALSKLKKIKKNRWKKLNTDEQTYLDDVIKCFEDTSIVIGVPSNLTRIVNRIGEIPAPTTPVGKKIGRPPKKLTKYIQEALNYQGLRSSFFPKYFQDIGIKACVYCNSQLTVAIDSPKFLKTKIRVDTKAKFQVDHYYPKSKYPHLSISVCNLYPVCSSCNQAKKDNIISFKLYSSGNKATSQSRYKFKLLNGSITKYLLDKNRDSIKFKFIDPQKPNSKKIVKGSFQDTFDIQGIYETQKDVAEELIVKAQVYNENYKKKLVDSFPKLFTHPSLSNRILIGNYSEPSNIHKRPIAKFTQDIARQLKLIE